MVKLHDYRLSFSSSNKWTSPLSNLLTMEQVFSIPLSGPGTVGVVVTDGSGRVG